MARYLLDTDIVSDLLKRPRDAELHDWIAGQAQTALHLAAVTVAEILHGIVRLERGRRRALLSDWFEHDLLPSFRGRILASDLAAARAWAGLIADAEAGGRPRQILDSQIAAIALARDLSLVARNPRDFEFTGARLATIAGRRTP